MNELNVLKRICRHLFLAVLLCAVSAATASAQVPTVTVDAKNVTIKELLQRIEANSQYTFAYIDADINPDKRVSVKAVNRSIASIIAEVLPNVNMEVKGLKIVLTAKRHEIDSSFDCEAYDCGFAVPNFAPGYAESVENDTAEAHCDTLRCTVRGRGEAVVIGCDPNTSLYFTNVHLPAVKYHIPKGHTGLDTEVFDEAD